jgi:L-amino acid N-acyltransferase YncA
MSASYIDEIVLRDVEVRDIPRITEIYNYYVVKSGDVTTFDEEALSVSAMEKRFRAITEISKLPYIAACMKEGGDVVGYAYARPYGERRSYQYSVENSVYISHEHHRMGLGMSLMRELMARLKSLGIKQIVSVLGTEEDNPASVNLHSRLGFKKAALFKKIGFKHGRWVDRLHMQASLDNEVGGVEDHVFS